jgi:opacity protein-like surface antigen
MLKKSVGFLALLAMLGFVAPMQADAQTTLYISGGGSFPTGDFGNYADTGWMIAGGAIFGVGTSGLGVGIEGFYGQNNHSVSEVDLNSKTSPYGVMAIIDYGFEAGSVQPYVFGGAGLLVHRFSADNVESESDSQFGYQFGAGLGFPIASSTDIYVEGRYMGSSDTNYFAALAGFAFGLGN